MSSRINTDPCSAWRATNEWGCQTGAALSIEVSGEPALGIARRHLRRCEGSLDVPTWRPADRTRPPSSSPAPLGTGGASRARVESGDGLIVAPEIPTAIGNRGAIRGKTTRLATVARADGSLLWCEPDGARAMLSKPCSRRAVV